jgi:hypothetical protein
VLTLSNYPHSLYFYNFDKEGLGEVNLYIYNPNTKLAFIHVISNGIISASLEYSISFAYPLTHVILLVNVSKLLTRVRVFSP